MPETTGAAEAQGASAAQPQGGAAQAHGADAQQAQGASADKGGPSLAELQAKVAELERDNAKYRSAERDRQKALDAETAAKRTSEERMAALERQLAEATTREQGRILDGLITAAASRLGFRSPDLAARLVDRSALDVDESGKPRNLDAVLKGILDKEPYLGKAATDFGGGPRGGTPQGTDMNALIRRAAGRPG